jgi:ketosteroid isomerase-like protein
VPDHPDVVVVGRLLDAFGAGDFDTVLALIAEGVAWHLPCGGTVLGAARDLHGVRSVAEAVLANMTHGEGTVRFQVESLFEADGLVVAVGRDTGAAHDKTLDLGVALVFRVADGRVVEYWQAVDDLDAFRAFWT